MRLGVVEQLFPVRVYVAQRAVDVDQSVLGAEVSQVRPGLHQLADDLLVRRDASLQLLHSQFVS